MFTYKILIKKLICSKSHGYTAIVSVVLSSVVALVIVSGLSALTITKEKIVRNTISSAQSYYTAEAGLEDMLLRIIDSALQYDENESLTLAGSAASYSVTQVDNELTINSSGDKNNYIRNVQISLTDSSEGASFNYGIQTGQGGILMKNSSRIEGNVYSNGNIQGVNFAEATGDVWVAGATGLIDGFTIGGDAHANTITDTDITGDAYYQSISGSSVGGTSYPGSADPDPADMPISDEQINGWKEDALAGGEMVGNYTYEDGNTSLGPKKITGDLTISGDGNDIFTLSGTLWVTGNLSLQNNGVIRLAAGYGDNSGMIIVDGNIDLINNFIACGSEGFDVSEQECNTPNDSYVLLLTTSNSLDTGDPAINQANNTQLRGILYAPNGLLFIQNSATLKEATAYQMQVENNSTIIYESGLINLNFTSGPGGGWNIGNWEEVE